MRLTVTRSAIQIKALQFWKESPNNGDGDDFVASQGRLQNFMERHSFSIRRRTTVSQHLPADMISKVVSFVMHIRKLNKIHSYDLGAIGNADETPCWMKMPGQTTIDRGKKSVLLLTTGHEKSCFTVTLSATADGKKLKPYIVFKGVRPIQHLFLGVVTALSKNKWMNEELTLDWLKRVWGQLAFCRRLLVWNAYYYHIMASVKEQIRNVRPT